MTGQLVRYPTTVAAGCTELDPARPHGILRERGMDVWTLNYTLRGRGCINRGRERWRSRVGDLLLWPPAVRHDYNYDQGTGHWTHLWVCFFPRKHWLDWLHWPARPGGVLWLHAREPALRRRVTALLREADRVLHSPRRRREDFALNTIETLLLCCDGINPRSDQAGLDTRIHAALDCIHHRCRERLTLRNLAAAANLSPSRFSHIFREQVGASPGQYLEQVRMARAQELLLMTARPVAEISYEVGYPDPLYFSRVFKRHAGRSPRDYRHASGAERD